PEQHDRLLDLCAAPGGKSTHLAELMQDEGEVWALERNESRVASLEATVKRLGTHAVHVVHGDGYTYTFPMPFDRVLVDAPCSGLGTLRRNPDLKWRQSPQAVAELQLKQQAILNSAARLLKPGGRLVYATCSLMPAENEVVAAAFSEQHKDMIPVDAREVLERNGVTDAEALVTPLGHLRLWPHRHATDGFYAAVWDKKA
ncbi:MAG TPA: RsmB/NOP family class I SAM-dependent RNA methyltransferase, partial [Aquabacterium sp.]|nr:RsmB/NOP family class I SAM-dependent RNA methyltransferase [Aquabacterium sp.]